MKKMLILPTFALALLLLPVSCGKSDGSSSGISSPKAPEIAAPVPQKTVPANQQAAPDPNQKTPEKEPQKKPEPPKELSLDEILKLPDDQINLTTALLLISRQEGDPSSLDTEKFAAIIDEMTAKLSGIILSSDTPEEIKNKITDFIYNQQGYKASRDIDDLRTTFLTNVLRMKTGNCIGLSQLWLCFAQKLNLPVTAVNIPNHTFLRWNDTKGNTFNIETLDIFDQISGAHEYGKSFSNEDLVKLKFVKDKAIQSGAYMRPLSNKAFISSVFSNVGAGQIAVSKMSRSGDEYRGLVQRGIQSLSKAIELDPKNFNAWYNRASVYAIYTKEYESAQQDLKTAFELNPAPMIYVLQGIAYAGMDNYDSAKEYVKKSLDDEELSPGSKDFALQKMAEIYLKNGEIEKGLELCAEQIKQDYKKSYFYDMKARFLVARNRLDEALKESFFAVQYAEQEPNPYITRGRIYFGQGKFDLAKNDLIMAVKLKPYWDNEEFADAHYMLGKIYLSEGRPKIAKPEFTRALDYNPAHKGALEEKENFKEK
ncbi:MAG: tetratricopeptide repeat protein [Planctomycetes bacterium]|nr:tetratricopeptide repeat protein [Planctomycetota bacterium]